MSLSIDFDTSYTRLPERFYARQAPQPVAATGSCTPGSGMPSPAIISRSSCRAVT